MRRVEDHACIDGEIVVANTDLPGYKDVGAIHGGTYRRMGKPHWHNGDEHVLVNKVDNRGDVVLRLRKLSHGFRNKRRRTRNKDYSGSFSETWAFS